MNPLQLSRVNDLARFRSREMWDGGVGSPRGTSRGRFQDLASWHPKKTSGTGLVPAQEWACLLLLLSPDPPVVIPGIAGGDVGG